jgi:hypothetical protein
MRRLISSLVALLVLFLYSAVIPVVAQTTDEMPGASEGVGAHGDDLIEDGLWEEGPMKDGFERDATDHGSTYNPKTGQNAHYDKAKKQWIDSKTGKPLSKSGGIRKLKTTNIRTSKTTKTKTTSKSSTIKKVAIVVVVGCLIATAIAVPVAVCCSQHHHHNNTDQQVALFNLMRARQPAPAPMHMPADLPMPSLP